MKIRTLFLLAGMHAWPIGGAAAEPIVTIKQQSVPEALVPDTNRLLFLQPMDDNGVGLELFRLQGEGVEYSPDGRWIAYDCKHKDGYYHIHLCRPDGTGDRCLTPLDNGLPPRHSGTPAWHPSGKYIVFAAEKKEHRGGSVGAIPGFGGRSDLWIMRADGSKAWPLTDLPDSPDAGVIIPKFSHDGTRLAWTERTGAAKLLQPRRWLGNWVVKVADFVDAPDGPRLANARSLAPPGEPTFNEAYGFSPDDRQIIFCSGHERRTALDSQIYIMDASDGGHLRRLTNGAGYNEHASYSPDGRHIVWMTNLDNRNGGTDWWIMNPDGSHPRRLTYFNQPGHPESGNWPAYAGLTHWARDGIHLLGGVQYSLLKQEGRIFLLTLDLAARGQ